jgi:hypothetical protein
MEVHRSKGKIKRNGSVEVTEVPIRSIGLAYQSNLPLYFLFLSHIFLLLLSPLDIVPQTTSADTSPTKVGMGGCIFQYIRYHS